MNLNERLKAHGVLLSDGAWGTEIAKKGLADGCPELLNVDHAVELAAIAGSYVDAGSDIILTNTFGGSPFKLAKYGVDARTEELNTAAVRISREAAGDRTLVFATIGPTGEFLEPVGEVTTAQMTGAFTRQTMAFREGGADGVLVETMSDIAEAGCAVEAARAAGFDTVVCSFTFDRGMKGFATMMGVKPQEAVAAAESWGVSAVGANCGAGIDAMIEVASLMRAATDLPLWFKPNAGLPELVGDSTVYRETPEVMASRLAGLIGAGASIVGGCCGSTPAHIRAFRAVIDSMAT